MIPIHIIHRVLELLSQIRIPEQNFGRPEAFDPYTTLVNSKYSKYDGSGLLSAHHKADFGKPVVDAELMSLMSSSKIRLTSNEAHTTIVSTVIDHHNGQQRAVLKDFIPVQRELDFDESDSRYLVDYFVEKRLENFNKKFTLSDFYKKILDIQNTTGHNSQRMKAEHLLELFSYNLRAQEKKFVLDMITKNVKIGVSLKSFFKVFAKLAQEDLFLTSEQRRYESIFGKNFDNELKFGEFVEVMLSQNAVSIQDLHKKLVSKKARQVIAEEKFDGERLQIHLSRLDPDEPFKVILFSRSGEVVSQKFGSILEEVNGAFQDSEMLEAIFDAEIIPFDYETGSVQNFQKMQKMKTVNVGLNKLTCKVIIFDIMLLNDRSLVGSDLAQRKKTLTDLFSGIDQNQVCLIENWAIDVNDADTRDSPSFEIFEQKIKTLFDLSKDHKNEGLIIKSKLLL